MVEPELQHLTEHGVHGSVVTQRLQQPGASKSQTDHNMIDLIRTSIGEGQMPA